MNSSSTSSSSTSTSTSTAVTPEAQPLFSLSSPLSRQGLRSPELQAQFLQEFQNKFRSPSDVHESSGVSSAAPPSPSSPLPSPFSPTPSSPWSSSSSSSSPCYDSEQARLSLSSPEFLSELKDSRTRPLRHVPAHNGLTVVFSGRGRRGGQASDPAPSTGPPNQKTSH